MPVKYIPDGFHTLTPYMTVNGAGRLIDFVKQAFGAVELDCDRGPDGTISHATLRIGDSMIEVSEANEKWRAMPLALHMYVMDTDISYNNAIRAGAVTLQEPQDMYYGERGAAVKDYAGNHWYIATRIR